MPRNVAVGLGLMEFPFDSVAGFWRWVDLCEAGGVDSLWQTDRMISREPILECMSVMAALAGRTRRIKFGVNVLSLAFRDPVLLAKQCATIDVLSEGRLLPAFGIGSPLAPEWRTLNLDTKTRGRKTDEGLEIIRRLWAEDAGRFRGRALPAVGRLDQPEAGAARSADVDRRLDPRRRSGAPRGLAPAGRPAARPPTISAPSSPRSARPRSPKAGRSTTTITAPASRFALAGPTTRLSNGCSRPIAGAPAATRKEHFAIGDAEAIVERIAAYVARRDLEIHPAPGGARRRRSPGANPPARRRGIAAGRRALATAAPPCAGRGRITDDATRDAAAASAPASSTPTARCSMSPRQRSAAPMCWALGARGWRRCGATSSCNTLGCARCRTATPISGR